jgi:hypothetical protein
VINRRRRFHKVELAGVGASRFSDLIDFISRNGQYRRDAVTATRQMYNGIGVRRWAALVISVCTEQGATTEHVDLDLVGLA